MALPTPDCVPEVCGPKCPKHVLDPETNTWIRCRRVSKHTFSTKPSPVPARFQKESFDAYKPSPLNQKAVDTGRLIASTFKKNLVPSKSLVFVGDDLSDRSRIACMCLNDCIALDLEVAYSTLALATDHYFNDRPAFSALSRPVVLLLELGMEIPNSSTFPILSEVFMTRHNANLYTFFTSRNPIAKFDTVYTKDFKEFFNSSTFMELKVHK